MTGRLTRAWQIWGGVLAATLLFIAACHIAAAPSKTTVSLRPGAEIRLRIFSLLGHEIPLRLEFHRGSGPNRNDVMRPKALGGYFPDANQPGDLKWSFEQGEPVTVSAALNAGPVVELSAMSASSFTAQRIGRSLKRNMAAPFSGFVARPGFNTLTVKVVSVGPSLLNEEAELVAGSPMTMKDTQPGYVIFQLGGFAEPLIWAFVGLWGAILLVITLRERAVRRDQRGK